MYEYENDFKVGVDVLTRCKSYETAIRRWARKLEKLHKARRISDHGYELLKDWDIDLLETVETNRRFHPNGGWEDMELTAWHDDKHTDWAWTYCMEIYGDEEHPQYYVSVVIKKGDS